MESNILAVYIHMYDNKNVWEEGKEVVTGEGGVNQHVNTYDEINF